MEDKQKKELTRISNNLAFLAWVQIISISASIAACIIAFG